MRIRWKSVCLGICVCLSLFSAAQRASLPKPPKELEPTALRLAAMKLNLQTSELEIVNSVILSYPLTGKLANVFAIQHKQNHKQQLIFLNSQGQELDIKHLIQNEIAKRDEADDAHLITNKEDRQLAKLLEGKAIEIAARKANGTTEDFYTNGAGLANYHYSKKQAFLFNVYRKSSNKAFYLTLDRQGNEVNEDRLREENASARFSLYGKMTEQLASRLNSSCEDEEIDLCIQAKMPFHRPPSPPSESSSTQEQTDIWLAEYRRFFATEFENSTRPIKQRLEQMGFRVLSDSSGPKLKVRVPVNVLRLLNYWDEISEIWEEKK